MEERSIESACAMWDKGKTHSYVKNLQIWPLIMGHGAYLITMCIGDSEDRFGAWSTEGCREVVREGNRRVCECSQLAHFGVLFVS